MPPPTTYKQTTNQTATYGEQSPSVLALQQSLNQKYANDPNYIKAVGGKPLALDSKYGPLTQAGVNYKPNQLIVTGTGPEQEYAQNSQYINQLLQNKSTSTYTGEIDPNTYSDSYTQMLDKIGSTSDLATKNLINSIKATKQGRMNDINQETDRLKQGLMSLGLETGNINFTPDLVYGHIAQAENARMQKLTQLDRDEATALIEAQQASDNKDFTVLKEKIDYIKGLKQDKINVLKDTSDSLSYQTKIAENQAHQIYDVMQTLDPKDQMSFLQALSMKYNIPLTGLVTALSDEKSARETANLKTENTKSIITKRSGTGTGGSGGKITVNSAASEIDSHLKPISKGGILGDDKYMAPEQWLSLRDTWVKNKLSKTTFDTLYKRYLNPLSYTKAGFTAPKGSTRTLVRAPAK